MTHQIDHIVEHFFRKKTLDEVSVYELERFIATHPYFAAGHFLRARKARLTEPGTAHQKIATAALYYPNPLWLQWLLKQDEEPDTATTTYDEGIGTEQTAIPDESRSVNHSDDIMIEETEQPDLQHGEEHSATETDIQTGTETDVASENLHQYEEQPTDQPLDEPAVTTMDADDNRVRESVHETVQESVAEVEEPNTTSLVENNVLNVDEDKETEIPVEGAVEESLPQQDHALESGSPEISENPEPLPEEEEPTQSDEKSRAAIKKTLGGVFLIPTKAEIEKGDVTFEPYHTIDYFASQGIRLQQSDLSKDKFGKQLKSFTEWLRSMKRLPQAPLDTNIDDATQQTIQRIAEHSFEEKEIVTETMAEVWIKQGNKEKAIDTLHKLSLLNPSKSHYFAAKIEQLKVS